MKNLKRTCLIVFCLFLFIITGCSDDDDSIKVYIETYDFNADKKISTKITSLETNILNGISTLKISGGDGKYTASSSDESAIDFEIIENYLHMTYYKLGTILVTISDANNEKIVLPITITEGKREIKVLESYADVQLEFEGDIEKYQVEIETIKTEIKDGLLPADARFELTYNSKIDSYRKQQGTYVLYPNPDSKDEFVNGTFTDEYIPYSENDYGYQELRFVSDSSENVYTMGKFQFDWNQLKASDNLPDLVGPFKQPWVKDYTDVYKARYPDLKITRAIAILVVLN